MARGRCGLHLWLCGAPPLSFYVKPMSPQEFQSRVRKSRRVMLPLAVVVLLLIFTGPFGLFGILIPPFQAALRTCLHISQDSADLVCIGLMLFSPFIGLLGLLLLNRHYGLFCSSCGCWRMHIFFVQHVSRYGTCPKCKSRIVEPV